MILCRHYRTKCADRIHTLPTSVHPNEIISRHQLELREDPLQNEFVASLKQMAKPDLKIK